MSQKAETGEQRSAPCLESGLEALRRSPAFRGPVEPLDDHEHANDHLALLYESREEQFAAVIPYIRQGLDRNERCVYIATENSRDAVIEAMRSGGIDVDDALESGALSVHDEQETYLRNGSFDPDDTLAFLDDAIAEATEEYEALRVTGEMAFVLGEDPDVEDLVRCESKANHLFEDVDGMALCQYNRERFPAEVIRDVVNTHPHLIHENRISHNAYYTPPSEFFGPDRPAREVDRMLGTLREQTDAKAELGERERFVREQTEIIARTDQTFEEKLQALFELGCDRFDLELGALARVDTADDWFEVEYVSDDHDHFQPGVELPLSETYCTAATEIRAAGSVSDPHEDGYDDITVYQEFGIRAYLGTYVEIPDGSDRTFFFITSESRDEDFSDDERAFVRSMGQWAKYELERRARERELREQTEHLSALVETTPECIKTVAHDGTLRQMNPAGLEMVEADSASDVVGECVYDLIAPEHRETFREFNERVCRGERGTLEFDIVGLDGTRRHMETHAAPLQHPDGTVSQVALTRDVTERKERERELERYEAITEVLADTVYAVDEEGRFTFLNEAAVDTFGYEREELLGEHISKVMAEPGVDRARALIDELLADESRRTAKFERTAITASGDRRICADHLVLLPPDEDGEFRGTAGIIRDITERKERERELERALDLLDKTERIADVGGWEIDVDTKEVFWTEHIFELLEVRADEEPPLDEALDMYHEEDQSVVEGAVEQALVSREPFDVEARIRTDSGDERWLRLQGVPEIVDDDVVSLRGAAQDVTERKQREQRLEELIDRLEESNERLEQFAYAASHDLQEPLRMVSSYLQLIDKRYSDALDEDGEEFLEYAVDGADRMRDMIEGLLAYSRVETQGDPLEPFDLDAAVDDVLSDLQFQIEESDAEITVDDLPRVEGDASQLRQVFQNLFENAITYSGDESPRIHVSAEHDTSEWIVSVRDEGIGIESDVQDRIFEVFQRLHTHDEYDGTGIGLALCERIVERHGGDIWVESEPGEETTFSFTLPVVQNRQN